MDISDLKVDGNYTENEICYIRYFGVSLHDEYGYKAYGLKMSIDESAAALMGQKNYTGSLQDHAHFEMVLQESAIHNYNESTDYCEQLENAIERKAKHYRDYFESGSGDLSELICAGPLKDDDDRQVADHQSTMIFGKLLQDEKYTFYHTLEIKQSLWRMFRWSRV